MRKINGKELKALQSPADTLKRKQPDLVLMHYTTNIFHHLSKSM
jgi:hypothetical protein